MDAQDVYQKDAAYIRTIFGEVSEHYFPALYRQDMIEDDDWRAAAGVEGGPFCYIPAERLIPF